MDNVISIYNKIEALPINMRKEVSHYIDFLIEKSKKEKLNKPQFGSLKGKIKLSPDFDEPLDDFKDYM